MRIPHSLHLVMSTSQRLGCQLGRVGLLVVLLSISGEEAVIRLKQEAVVSGR